MRRYQPTLAIPIFEQGADRLTNDVDCEGVAQDPRDPGQGRELRVRILLLANQIRFSRGVQL